MTNLANSNVLDRATENTKAAEVAANQVFRFARPTGLEPATSGVTGGGVTSHRESAAREIVHTYSNDLRKRTPDRAGVKVDFTVCEHFAKGLDSTGEREHFVRCEGRRDAM